jgi:hypothetical protein
MKADIPCTTNSKTLMYISVMMSFRNQIIRKFDKSSVYDTLSAVPSIIIDGLMSRFTETPRGSTELGVLLIGGQALSFADTRRLDRNRHLKVRRCYSHICLRYVSVSTTMRRIQRLLRKI